MPFKSWKKQASPSLKPQETGSGSKGRKRIYVNIQTPGRGLVEIFSPLNSETKIFHGTGCLGSGIWWSNVFPCVFIHAIIMKADLLFE